MSIDREYLILEIAADSEAEFAALEGRMGTPLAGSQTTDPEDAWWFAAPTPSGGTRRIFSFQSWQRVALSGLLGDISTAPGLRITVERVDAARFKPCGPGAEKTVRKHPPMILPGMIDLLYGATGRPRLR